MVEQDLGELVNPWVVHGGDLDAGTGKPRYLAGAYHLKGSTTTIGCSAGRQHEHEWVGHVSADPLYDVAPRADHVVQVRHELDVPRVPLHADLVSDVLRLLIEQQRVRDALQ